MEDWNTAWHRGKVSATASAMLSSAAMSALGKKETGSAFAATNAISHSLWGDEASRQDHPSVRYTLAGYAIHHASAMFWSVLFERVAGELLDRRQIGKTLAAAAATSAVACLVDYTLTPQRLRPGYEKRLSAPSLALVYAAFGLGLAAGAVASRR